MPCQPTPNRRQLCLELELFFQLHLEIVCPRWGGKVKYDYERWRDTSGDWRTVPRGDCFLPRGVQPARGCIVTTTTLEGLFMVRSRKDTKAGAVRSKASRMERSRYWPRFLSPRAIVATPCRWSQGVGVFFFQCESSSNPPFSMQRFDAIGMNHTILQHGGLSLVTRYTLLSRDARCA